MSEPRRELRALDGIEVAVERLGPTGVRPLAMLHGLGASATHDLRPAATHPLLADRERILIDLPGFGRSKAPDDWPATVEAHAEAALAVLDRLGDGELELFGHSMGGSVAILVAARLSRVQRLIIAEPLLDPGHGTLSAHIARQSEAAFVRRGYTALCMATRRQAARGDAAAQGVLPSMVMASPAIMHRSAVSLQALRQPTFRARLLVLPIPRRFIAGARSGLDVEPLREAGIEIRIVPDAGHAMMHERLDAFVEAISVGA